MQYPVYLVIVDMSEKRKANTNSPYFLTLTVVGWVDVFTRECYSEIIVESLEYCRKNKGLEVYAFVIMSNHIHLIVRRQEGLLSDVIRDFKSFTAKRIIHKIETNAKESRKDWLLHLFKFHAKFKQQNESYQFWQKTSYPVELFSHKIFNQKLYYIHNNPV
jgi:REP element-mobilizing transposase RayT